MLKLSAKPATYEDLLALPENVVGELIDGMLYTRPRPAMPHASVASGLGFDIGGPGGGSARGRTRPTPRSPFDAVPLDLMKLWEPVRATEVP